MVSMFPGDGIGFVVLSNLNGTGLPELLIRQATDLILDLKPKDWIGEAAERKAKGMELAKQAETKKLSRRIPKTKPAHALEAYAGDYHHPGYGDLQVTLQNGKLTFSYNGITTPLEHWHYETFNGQKAGRSDLQRFQAHFPHRCQRQGGGPGSADGSQPWTRWFLRKSPRPGSSIRLIWKNSPAAIPFSTRP